MNYIPYSTVNCCEVGVKNELNTAGKEYFKCFLRTKVDLKGA